MREHFFVEQLAHRDLRARVVDEDHLGLLAVQQDGDDLLVVVVLCKEEGGLVLPRPIASFCARARNLSSKKGLLLMGG